MTNTEFQAIINLLNERYGEKPVQYGQKTISVNEAHLFPLRAVAQHPSLYNDSERAYIMEAALNYGSSSDEQHFTDENSHKPDRTINAIRSKHNLHDLFTKERTAEYLIRRIWQPKKRMLASTGAPGYGHTFRLPKQLRIEKEQNLLNQARTIRAKLLSSN